MVTFWSRYELNLQKQWKSKKHAKKISLSMLFYKDKNNKLGSIIELVFIAWARNGHGAVFWSFNILDKVNSWAD